MNSETRVLWGHPLVGPSPIQPPRRGAAFKGRGAGRVFVLRDRKRRIPEGEDCVTDEFVDRPVFLDDQGRKLFEIRRREAGYRRSFRLHLRRRWFPPRQTPAGSGLSVPPERTSLKARARTSFQKSPPGRAGAHAPSSPVFRDRRSGIRVPFRFASSIAASNEVSCSGFERKAEAPMDLQSSRISLSLCAVMTMVGIRMPARMRWR